MVQNLYITLAEDLKSSNKACSHPNNWVEQKEQKIEREKRKKRNQNGTSTLERELCKRKRTLTMGGHLTISQDEGGNSKPQRKGEKPD